jgi:hypothetical protein
MQKSSAKKMRGCWIEPQRRDTLGCDALPATLRYLCLKNLKLDMVISKPQHCRFCILP